MAVEFDPVKNAANVAKHGLSFADFTGFDAKPSVEVDDRYNYDETRYRAHGGIEGEGHCIVFTFTGDTTRLISFRRAHDKEMRRYD